MHVQKSANFANINASENLPIQKMVLYISQAYYRSLIPTRTLYVNESFSPVPKSRIAQN